MNNSIGFLPITVVIALLLFLLLSWAPIKAQADRKTIRNEMGRCLDVAGGVNANRTNVQIFDCNGTASQQWFVAAREIRHVMGRCLDVAGGVNANRTNVQIFDCNGTISQRWLVSDK